MTGYALLVFVLIVAALIAVWSVMAYLICDSLPTVGDVDESFNLIDELRREDDGWQ